MRIVLSLLLALVTVAVPQAALNMPSASNATVTFGDMEVFSGLQQLSVAATVKVPTPVGTLGIIVSQWGNTENNHSWAMHTESVDKVAFCTNTPTAFGDYYCIASTDGHVVAGATLRLMVIRNLAADVTTMWVNGVSVPFVCTNCQPITTGLRNSPTDVTIGRTGQAGAGMTAEYSEIAVWGEAVPTWVGEAYSKGMSPNGYRNGGILYVPLKTTTDTRDVWGGLVGTLTAGTNVAHPPMFNVQAPQ